MMAATQSSLNKIRGESPFKGKNLRPPFVSTAKQGVLVKQDLPLRSRSADKNRPLQPSVILEPDFLSNTNSLLLQKQSVRWVNLSRTFWLLFVMDSHRNVDKSSLTSFYEVMEWRIHNKINEEEFSSLYADWMSKSEPIRRRKYTVGIFGTREFLLEKNCRESDLDLLIGMAIYENNKSLLGTPISYLHRNFINSMKSNLEVCGDRWMRLSEELFFLLDTPGYGILRFDELFIFAGCLVIGMEGLSNESELEDELTLTSLTAITLQLMRDAGAAINISSESYSKSTNLLPSATSRNANMNPQSNNNSSNKSSKSSSSSLPTTGKFSVTLPMFKAFLIRKGLGEVAISTLIGFLQEILVRVGSLSRSHAPDLFQSCFPLESPFAGDCIGPPRLWQQSVCIAAGIQNTQKLSGAVQPLVLFLITDADKYLSGAVRACEKEFSAVMRGQLLQSAATSNPAAGASDKLKNDNISNNDDYNAMELLDVVKRLWVAFRKWGTSALPVEAVNPLTQAMFAPVNAVSKSL